MSQTDMVQEAEELLSQAEGFDFALRQVYVQETRTSAMTPGDRTPIEIDVEFTLIKR